MGRGAVESKNDEEIQEISANDAQKTLPTLLGRAQYGGERTLITRNGKPAAALVPVADLERLRALDAA